MCYGLAAQFQVPHLEGRLFGSPLALTHWLVSHTRPVLAPRAPRGRGWPPNSRPTGTTEN
jgi:hypothetical protein